MKSGRVDAVRTLIDEYGVDPNSTNDGVSVHGIVTFVTSQSIIPILYQKVLPPVLLALNMKNWEIFQLLTEQYGCKFDQSLLSLWVTYLHV